MHINHRPYVDVAKAEEIYTEKDGVPVYYVCTSGRDQSAEAGDIFYRDTPHPEFGNRYFILIGRVDGLRIGGADWIEAQVFNMIEGPDGLEYSRHRHDYRKVGDVSIDGGRAYLRLGYEPGSTSPEVRRMVVRHGQFREDTENG